MNAHPVIQTREVGDDVARFLTGDAAPSAHRETSEAAPSVAPASTPAPTVPASTSGDAGNLATREDVAALDERLSALMARGPVGDESTPHPLAQFRSLGDYMLAVYNGDADPALLQRAWADQTTADNPGIMAPSWSSEVHGIVDLGRRMITGTGGPASAGESGMTLAWPYFDGDLYALVGLQATEKTDVTSVKVPLKKGSADLRTFAGGSDIALQVIERGDPSYLDAYGRIMAAAYGAVTDNAYVADLVALPAAYIAYTADTIIDKIIEASLEVEAATGQPPSVIGIGRDIFATVAGYKDGSKRPLFPFIGASNADGTLGSAGLTLDVLGIPAVPVAGAAAAGKIVVTNGAAARWVEDGPRTITAADVARLGRDVAVYGFADTAAYAPAGVVVLSNTPKP
jgi:hypothetical protein